MSFWENIEVPTTGEFSSGGGSFEPIPDNTDVLAMVDNAEWPEYQGERHIEIRWIILAPAAYKNRKIFQKVQVLHTDIKKSDKAKRMSAAIDFNAGGTLVKLKKEPNDVDLARGLLNKQMVLKLMKWEYNGKSGNWVSAVSPKSTPLDEPAAKPAKASVPDDFSPDIPF